MPVEQHRRHRVWCGGWGNPCTRIYVTHCAAKKDDALKGTGKKVPPDSLYTATPTRRFMTRCKDLGVRWAIFSDHYGVWLADERREWYGDEVGDPDKVTERRFLELVENFDERLKGYDEIYFYHNPGRFHPLYQRLLMETKLRERIVPITHLYQIIRSTDV
jgi:hypothetical protein